jgi:hypothetical protein
VTKVVSQAANGDMQASREIFDRLDGKVTQPIQGDLTIHQHEKALSELD